jgi:hypothetical protein
MKKDMYVYAAFFIAALGGMLFGFDTTVTSGAEKTIQSFFNLNGFWHGFTISIALIGTLVGVTNTGNRAGSQLVQLYINDVISSVTTSVKELKGFEKVTLNPGEKERVEFVLQPKHLSLLDQNLKRIVESGTFKVMIGSSSKNILLNGEFVVKR